MNKFNIGDEVEITDSSTTMLGCIGSILEVVGSCDTYRYKVDIVDAERVYTFNEGDLAFRNVDDLRAYCKGLDDELPEYDPDRPREEISCEGLDDEVMTINKIVTLMNKLDDDCKHRVVRYLESRFD